MNIEPMEFAAKYNVHHEKVRGSKETPSFWCERLK